MHQNRRYCWRSLGLTSLFLAPGSGYLAKDPHQLSGSKHEDGDHAHNPPSLSPLMERFISPLRRNTGSWVFRLKYRQQSLIEISFSVFRSGCYTKTKGALSLDAELMIDDRMGGTDGTRNFTHQIHRARASQRFVARLYPQHFRPLILLQLVQDPSGCGTSGPRDGLLRVLLPASNRKNCDSAHYSSKVIERWSGLTHQSSSDITALGMTTTLGHLVFSISVTNFWITMR